MSSTLKMSHAARRQINALNNFWPRRENSIKQNEAYCSPNNRKRISYLALQSAFLLRIEDSQEDREGIEHLLCKFRRTTNCGTSKAAFESSNF